MGLMAVTRKHQWRECAALRQLIPEGPLCFHRFRHARHGVGGSAQPPAARRGELPQATPFTIKVVEIGE
jgi:hypothetical protein